MKELSIEEKAKAYDEVREKIAIRFGSNVADEIFSRFEMSEDEKIRKGIINYFQCQSEEEPTRKEIHNKWIAWLEKQGEQKPMDKVEPKFKVGDWVVYNRNDHSREIIQVYDIRDDRYYFTDNVHLSWSIKECDEKSHLWTIQDAKDGDVLTCYSDIKGQPIEQTGIIKQYVGRHGGCSNSFKVHFGVDWDNNVVIEGYMGSSNIYPSTKEQRELLFKKMKEARYEWDAETKELKELEEISGNQGGIFPATEETVRKNLQDNDFRRMFENESKIL